MTKDVLGLTKLKKSCSQRDFHSMGQSENDFQLYYRENQSNFYFKKVFFFWKLFCNEKSHKKVVLKKQQSPHGSHRSRFAAGSEIPFVLRLKQNTPERGFQPKKYSTRNCNSLSVIFVELSLAEQQTKKRKPKAIGCQ